MGGYKGSAESRVTRIVPFFVLTATTVKKQISTLLKNSTTDDAANLATTLHASPGATRAVLENVNARGRGRKREEASSPRTRLRWYVVASLPLTPVRCVFICPTIFAGSYATIQNLENTAQG